MDLRFNEIESLPESFGNLVNLKSLSLWRSRLSYLPESFGNLNKLSFLDLNSASLTSLPDSFSNLSSLRDLQLSNNKFKEIPTQIQNLTKLGTLSFEGNSATYIPDFIGELPYLNKLILSRNNITEIPEHLMEKLTNTGYIYTFLSQTSDLPTIYAKKDDDLPIADFLPKILLLSQQLTHVYENKPHNFTENDGSIVKIFDEYGSLIRSYDLYLVLNGNIYLSEAMPTAGTYIIKVESKLYRGYNGNHRHIFTRSIVIDDSSSAHNVTVITRYLDDALPEASQTYSVADGGRFEQPFKILDGYDLYNYSYRIQPVFDVDMDNKTVSLDVVEKDYIIELEFDKTEHRVRLNTKYLDKSHPETTQTDWIRNDESYSQTYKIAEGYQIVNADQLPADVVVDEISNTVTIKSVTQDYEINLEFEMKMYDIVVQILYDDHSREDQITTYTVPYGERFETALTIDEGYAIKKSQISAPGASVNRSKQTITINQVTGYTTVTITVR